MELVVSKNGVISENGTIPDSFYEREKNCAATLISLSIIREMFENNLITKDEYMFILDKYKDC